MIIIILKSLLILNIVQYQLVIGMNNMVYSIHGFCFNIGVFFQNDFKISLKYHKSMPVFVDTKI